MSGEEPTTAAVQAAPKKDPGIRTTTTLFIRKVPFDAAQAEFEHFFSTFGPLRSCFLIGADAAGSADSSGKKNKGFGFVHFADAADAAKALEELKKKKFRDRKVKAEYALRKHVQPTAEIIKPAAKKKRERAEATAAIAPSNKIKLVLGGCPKLPDRKAIYKRMRKEGGFEDMELTEPDTIVLSFADAKSAVAAGKHLAQHVFKAFTMTVTAVEAAANPKSHRLIVRNVSFGVSEEELRQAFAAYGELVELVLPRKPGGGPRGYAFVQFKWQSSAEKALKQVNGTEIGGRLVAVDWALPKKAFEQIVSVDTSGDPGIAGKCEDAGSMDECEVGAEECVEEQAAAREAGESSGSEGKGECDLENTVFVRNLAFDCQEEDLRKVLARFGPIKSCKIVRDEKTGLGKGTAFCQFAHKRAQLAAISAKPGSEDNKSRQPSMLIDPDAQDGGQVAPVLANRQLIVLPAVDRKAAKKLLHESTDSYDRRHLALIRESSITAYPKLYCKADIQERQEADRARLRQLKRDPNLFISPTRLSLRKLPLSVDNRSLRQFIKDSLASIKLDTRIVQVKVVSGDGGKSRGFAFCELADHSAALQLLRHLIKNPLEWRSLSGKGERQVPVIEFATEKKTVVDSRQKRIAAALVSNSNAKRVRQ